MSEKTNIQWCDSTVNFWSGCTKVSPGCKNCYAETRDKRHLIEDKDHWGKGAPRLKHVGAVKEALAMNREPWISELTGIAFSNLDIEPGLAEFPKGFHRRRIFTNSLSDWLDDEVPIEWFVEMMQTVLACEDVTWILCTKRPELWSSRMYAVIKWCENEAAFGKSPHEELDAIASFAMAWIDGQPPKNIILLASVENQEMADKRIPELLKIPAVCHGLSLEPLLGPVDLRWTNKCKTCSAQIHALAKGKCTCGHYYNGIDWLIIGGESGNKARPCNVEWIRSLVAQGKSAGVATFVKQLGADPIEEKFFHSDSCIHDDCSLAGGPEDCDGKVVYETLMLKDKKGGDMEEWPEDLRVQEFPEI